MGSNSLHSSGLWPKHQTPASCLKIQAGAFLLTPGLDTLHRNRERVASTLYENFWDWCEVDALFNRSVLLKEVTADDVIAYCKKRGAI